MPSLPLAWSNESLSGTFTGYAVFPLAAGAIEDTEYAFDVPRGTGFLDLAFTADAAAEFYVAAPSCDEPNVADCRSEEHYTDDFNGYEVELPEPGTWRFELAGSFAIRDLPVHQVNWSMDIARLAPVNATA